MRNVQFSHGRKGQKDKKERNGAARRGELRREEERRG